MGRLPSFSPSVNVHRCWAEISATALRHNLRTARACSGRNVEIMGVVKANAYGHGLLPVARLLGAAGIDAFGVAQVAEARQLRLAGLDQPILVLSPALPGEYATALRHRLALTISSPEEARGLNTLALRKKVHADIHLNVDTGMGRIGVWHEEAANLLATLRSLRGLRVRGLCSHFASADSDPGLTQRQWQRFQPFLHEPDGLHHIANSAALLSRKGFQAEMVRCGLMLYGVAPSLPLQKKLQPVLTWKSRVTLLRQVPAGRTVSYGATYRLPHAQTLATVAVGYGDGYFRALSSQAHVLIGGQRCPIRGRVTMDQIVVDVSRVRSVPVGAEVVLLGRQKNQVISAEELARQAGTISYEILTNVGARVARVYLE